MKRGILIFIFILTCNSVISQSKAVYDTGFVQARYFNTAALKQLKSSKDFQYERLREPPLSLWDKFWVWVWWKIAQVLSTRQGRITFWSLIIIIAVIVIGFFVMKMMRSGRSSLFERNSKGINKYSLSQEDIHHISFDEEIEKAASAGNFRMAVRLQYLQALKKLSDKGYINWRINKTNTDYLSEISSKPFSNMFTRLTSDFEYTWYGEKQIGREEYAEARKQFQQFNNEV